MSRSEGETEVTNRRLAFQTAVSVLPALIVLVVLVSMLFLNHRESETVFDHPSVQTQTRFTDEDSDYTITVKPNSSGVIMPLVSIPDTSPLVVLDDPRLETSIVCKSTEIEGKGSFRDAVSDILDELVDCYEMKRKGDYVYVGPGPGMKEADGKFSCNCN